MGARTFIQGAKKGDALFVYAILALDPETQQHEIPIQYQNYKDVFEKKNANTLLKHRPYDCVIDLEEGVHSYLDPSIICHKTNFRRFENMSTKISKKGSFDIPSLQLVFQSYLSRRRMDLYACVLITVD